MQRLNRPVAALGFAALLTVAACGSDGGASTDDTSDTTTADTGASDEAPDDSAAPDTTDADEFTSEDADDGDGVSDKPDAVLPTGDVTELVVTDLVEGEGEAAQEGDTIVVHFLGMLSADGTVFTDTSATGQPVELPAGADGVFPGWDTGTIGVKAGGRRQIDVPASLAFGETGDGGSIPPDADLTLVIDVIEVVEPPPPPSLAPQADAADCPAPDGSSDKQQEFEEYPPTCIDVTKTYTAEIVTNKGTLVAELDPEQAPVAVNNFVVLARYHYFDDTECHRAIPDFMVQCGDPTATGSGGPGYRFGDELPGAGEYQIGSLAMANSGADTNGSQFFIITGPNGQALPPQYSLFGQVTEGIDDTLPALDALGNDDPAANGVPPLEPIIIESVTITES